ncbi:MAG: toxin-antitoxin system HicB family antitoxin [Deltaproteobacteria bacterium]|nr:toxin-antitoxin system HicB family antitoxin [Deltaproteobacteria bacterium]
MGGTTELVRTEAPVERARKNILDAAAGWLDVAVKHGDHIPPAPRGMSGKLLVRVPKSLHESIARRAEIEGVSINQWIVAALARADS